MQLLLLLLLRHGCIHQLLLAVRHHAHHMRR